jgi:hypothetical protein
MPSLETFRPEKGRVVARTDVPSRYKWDLSAICRSVDEWQADYRRLGAAIDEFKQFQGTLNQGAGRLLDAFRSMSKDLFEMTMSFRPRRWTLFRVLIVPTIVPGILTAWKVNLGNAARVVVVAELVGATGGVGYELLRQQQLFDMAGAIAWTLQLVLFVLVVQQTINAIEGWALRYRAVSERAI